MDGVEITGTSQDRFDEILTPEALAFVAALQREFGARRLELLQARQDRQTELSAAAPWTSFPRPSTCASPSGGSPLPRPVWWTAAWRSPARSTGR
nr:hypothetical protein GCM10020093_105390 [Planobispora longispora]